ncbi:molybdopterin molybdotransferase MoeA [Brevibacterium spongiae]|uniref:Molybdopterin molybdenumtransferase n=1 Tax=Brevibacterium spongiae TaxID=2909672 RepID=A0ABY5SXI1_9MICO|nr:molybdopterin molybdotransferase MoeA [Brevibacterium spongiae]UVI37731.1 molybdopterin molybdotransferase MoeA [Brevibacterium spongiae]
MTPEDYSELIAELTPTAHPETVAAREAIGRTLRVDLVAQRSLPAFPTSAMDGFALDGAALQDARGGGAVPVIGDVPAGHDAPALRPGTAVRVMTGAPIPTGTEAVVPVEFTNAQATGGPPRSIRVSSLPEEVAKGWNIRAVGEDITAGDVVIAAGSRLSAAGVGTLAMLGIDEIAVDRAPRIGVIVTGDELRTTGTEAAGPLILNSNLPMLASMIAAEGSDVIEATCSDDSGELRGILGEMRRVADLVITTGGISAGAFEVVRQTLDGEHSRFLRLGLRPGAPQGHGRFGDLPLLHLPGTPQGAFIGFHLFARSLMNGQVLRTRWKKGLFAGPELAHHPKAVTLRPGAFTDTGEIRAADRARLPNFAAAEAIIRIPRGTGRLSPGSVIDYLEC